MIKNINGDNCHDLLSQNVERKLAFKPDNNYNEWKNQVRKKLTELLGLDKIEKNSCPLNLQIEEKIDFPTYERICFTFESEKGNFVPAYLLLPKQGLKKYPVAITLQGHSTGFHNSIGIVKYDGDESYQERGAFGIQAVENGFAALCIEQRGMGKNRSSRYPGVGGPHACAVTSLTALNLGRTIIGERVWDISRSIDALKHFEDLGLDLEKIMVTGNSGGGTASYYAACYDERIKYSAPSCGFCSYKDSVMSLHHCVCNYIPNICEWLEMGDLACLIAPRRLTVFAGIKDTEFPFEGVKNAFDTVNEIYKAAGVGDKCRLAPMPKGHWWCKDIVWQVIKEDIKELGW